MDKRRFETAELEIVYFESKDVVTLSNGSDSGDGDYWDLEFGG